MESLFPTPEEARPLPRREIPLIGRSREKEFIGRAIKKGLLPTALLLTGSPGVGKSRFAGFIAQSLLCTEEARPCHECSSCKMASNMSHPDIHWFFPHSSPGSGTTAKQIESVEKQRIEKLSSMRENSLEPSYTEGDIYYISTVRLLRSMAYKKASTGQFRAFILCNAEELAGADGTSSPSANAFLKILEEPPEGTFFILTSPSPHRLPATIRSRTSELRLGPLSRSELVAVFNKAMPMVQEEDLEKYLPRDHGAVGAVYKKFSSEWQEVRGEATSVISLVSEQNNSEFLNYLSTLSYKTSRGDFTALLGHMEEVLFEISVDEMKNNASLHTLDVSLAAEFASLVNEALSHARSNGTPFLILHRLYSEMGRLLENANAPAR